MCFIAVHSQPAPEYLVATIRPPRLLVQFVDTAGHAKGLVPLHRADLYAVSAIARVDGQNTVRPIHLFPFRLLQINVLFFYTAYEIWRKSKRMLKGLTGQSES